MLETHTETGKSRRRSSKVASPFELLKKIRATHPEATQDEIDEMFHEKMQMPRHAIFVREVNAFYSRANTRSVVKALAEPKKAKPAERPPIKRETKAERAERVSRGTDDFVAMATGHYGDTLMPNGKVLRDNTKEDLIKLGGQCNRIASHLKDGQTVGEGLTEKRLAKIFK